MIWIAGMILGAATGWIRAGRRGGSRLDRLHWAAGYMILGAIVGLLVTVFADRWV